MLKGRGDDARDRRKTPEYVRRVLADTGTERGLTERQKSWLRYHAFWMTVGSSPPGRSESDKPVKFGGESWSLPALPRFVPIPGASGFHSMTTKSPS